MGYCAHAVTAYNRSIIKGIYIYNYNMNITLRGPIKTTVPLKWGYMGFHVSLGECIQLLLDRGRTQGVRASSLRLEVYMARFRAPAWRVGFRV